MPNRLMTNDEVNKEIIAPFMRALADDIEARALRGDTSKRLYPSPGGGDLLPICVDLKTAEEAKGTVQKLREIAGQLERGE